MGVEWGGGVPFCSLEEGAFRTLESRGLEMVLQLAKVGDFSGHGGWVQAEDWR